MNFSFKDFFSKCDQIRRKLRIWPHLLKKSLKKNFIFFVVVSSTMASENSQNCSVQITGKCICETFHLPCMMWSLIPMFNIPHKFARKRLFLHAKSFKKKVPPYFGGRTPIWMRMKHYALSSYLFPFLKVSSLTFVVQTMVFQAKLPSQCVIKVIQYGYEVFQTVLSLNCQNHS